jgi:Dyp-type peroxidase family
MSEADPRLELDDIQGLLRHGYAYFDRAAYCLFEIVDRNGMRDWLRRLLDPRVRWIDSADLHASRLASDDCGVAIAFSRQGLRALGVEEADLQTFVPEFQEGMAAPHRSRLLGDTGASDPGGWAWGREDALHGMLIVFAPESGIEARLAEIRNLQGCPRIWHRVNGVHQPGERLGTVKEPFGFADGISQPIVAGLTRKPPPPDVRKLRAGEFVLGYPNEVGRMPASPSMRRNSAVFPLAENARGRADLGRNGSYLVVRQLEQNVARFEAFLEARLQERLRDLPNATPRQRAEERERFAAKLVGRWRSGAPLTRYPYEDRPQMTQAELENENGFSYHREDRHGLRCPIGAHIRRANPRDSLADGLGISRERAQELVDQHRILRRGRVYTENGQTGLMFLCLNTNIERQFEFVQGSWVMHPEFGGLAGETDPLLGNAGPTHGFTEQRTLLGERCQGLAQFVTVKGGAYFFLPGMQALRCMATL